MSLGMSPLHGVTEYEGATNALRGVLQFADAHGDRFYPFRSLAFHKTRWRGRTEVLFAATKDIGTLRAVLCTLKICNVICADREERHPIYDYRLVMEEWGLQVVEERDFQLFRGDHRSTVFGMVGCRKNSRSGL